MINVIFRFWAGPIVTVIAMYAIALWSREKTVVGVENFVALCGHLYFMVSLDSDGISYIPCLSHIYACPCMFCYVLDICPVFSLLYFFLNEH